MPKKKEKPEMVLLEKDERFSNSMLWDLQRAAYTQFGMEAWTQKGVPFYLTSNPFTARQYSQAVVGFIRDCIKGDSGLAINKTKPVYIFDLGAGTGRFGFLFLKQLSDFLAQVHLLDTKICYVMTDIVKSNIDFCKSHPYLQEFIKLGTLDFAYYHSEQNEPLELLISKKKLSPEEVLNPTVIIGNYFFDTIHQDLFKTIHGKLHEGRVTITAASNENIGPLKPSNPELIKAIECSYSYVPVEKSNYYEDMHVNQILEEYRKTFDNVPFLFPKGAFQVINYFAKLSPKGLFILAGDQGVCTEKQIKEWGEPRISKHGSFSISVSYHAIAKYLRSLNGVGLLTTRPDPMFVVLGGILGGDSTKFSETRYAFKQSVDAFEPSDYWKLMYCTEEEWKTPSLEYILLLLKLGNWDPINFHAFFPVIRSQMGEASPKLLEDLVYTIEQVWGFFYPISRDEGDFVMNLGVILFELKRMPEALKYFERSLIMTGARPVIYRNMAACYMAMQVYDKALEYMEKAKE